MNNKRLDPHNLITTNQHPKHLLYISITHKIERLHKQRFAKLNSLYLWSPGTFIAHSNVKLDEAIGFCPRDSFEQMFDVGYRTVILDGGIVDLSIVDAYANFAVLL